MKKALISLAVMAMTLSTNAQNQKEFATANGASNIQLFKHLDIALTAGTEGIGLDVATPINDWAQVRAGFSFMPTFNYNMEFGVEMENVKPEDQNSTFDKMADLMENFCGVRPERHVRMKGTPKLTNFKVLVDFYPLKQNKHWHATAGFYWGNGHIANADVEPISMNSLVAVGMFNSMYKRCMGKEPLIDYGDISVYNEEIQNKFRSYGLINVPNGIYTHDIVAEQDIYWDYTYVNDDMETVHQKGDLRYKKGDVIHKEGETFRLSPDENNLIAANAFANAFKPYLGIGYNTSISKDKKTNIAIDAGVMLWGGAPSVIVRNPVGQDANGKVIYQNIDFIRDLRETTNNVGKYVDIIDNIVAYPVISIRLSQKLF